MFDRKGGCRRIAESETDNHNDERTHNVSAGFALEFAWQFLALPLFIRLSGQWKVYPSKFIRFPVFRRRDLTDVSLFQ